MLPPLKRPARTFCDLEKTLVTFVVRSAIVLEIYPSTSSQNVNRAFDWIEREAAAVNRPKLPVTMFEETEVKLI